MPFSKIKHRWTRRQGASQMEYAILIGLIASAGIAGVATSGDSIRALFGKAEQSMTSSASGPSGGGGTGGGSPVVVPEIPGGTGASAAKLAWDGLGYVMARVGSPENFALAVVNQGDAASPALSLSSFTVSGLDFQVVSTTCGVLQPGQSCEVVFRFNPVSEGSKMGAVAFQTPQGPQSSPFVGEATPALSAVLSWSGQTDVEVVQNQSTSTSMTLHNTGDAPTERLTAGAFSITANQGFSVDPNGCVTSGVLAPGASCSVDVSFTSTTLEDKTATLLVQSGSVQARQTLNGTTTPLPAPVLAWSGSGDFEVVQGHSLTRSLVLQNTGNAATQKLTAASFTGLPAQGFTVDAHLCTDLANVPAGGSCDVAITFASTTVDTKSATLTVKSDGQEVAQSLQGTTTPAPAPTWSASSTLPSLPAGSAYSQVVPLAETADNATLTYSARTLPTGYSFDPSTRTLTSTMTSTGTQSFVLRASSPHAGFVDKTFTVEFTQPENTPWSRSNTATSSTFAFSNSDFTVRAQSEGTSWLSGVSSHAAGSGKYYFEINFTNLSPASITSFGILSTSGGSYGNIEVAAGGTNGSASGCGSFSFPNPFPANGTVGVAADLINNTLVMTINGMSSNVLRCAFSGNMHPYAGYKSPANNRTFTLRTGSGFVYGVPAGFQPWK